MVTTSGSMSNLEPVSHPYEARVSSDNGVHSSTFTDDDDIPNNIAGNENNITNRSSITNIFRWGVPKETDAEQIKIAQALESRYASEADYSRQGEKGCMEGTREQVLDEIGTWIRDLKGPHVLWVTGMLGTGKTAIASTTCSRISDDADIILAGSFFCSRLGTTEAQHDVRCVVPTLARLLARQSATFANALAAELERHPMILDQPVEVQVKILLYTPLLALKHSPATMIFVIDALDECGGQLTSDRAPNDTMTRQIASGLINALIQFSPPSGRLPVKFMLTSRPETHVRNAFAVSPTLSKVLRLHDVPKYQVTADIRLYVTTILDQLAPELLTEDNIGTLVEFSDGVFIVAVKTVQQLIQPDPEGAAERFEALFDVPRDQWSMAHLDDIYAPTIENAEKIDRVESGQRRWRRVLAVLLASPITLSVGLVIELLGLRSSQAHATLSSLQAVVNVPDDPRDVGLRSLHPSLASYLHRRAPDHIAIVESLGHEILSNKCLDIMGEDLHFNVSKSLSSLEQNPSVRSNGICLSLEYACLHWTHHVFNLFKLLRSDLKTDEELRSQVERKINSVFRPRLLFWVEIMSVLGQVQRAIAMLVLAAKSVQCSELSCFLHDASSFIVSSREAIERSAPHIYLSALPFANKNSLVYQDFYPLFTGLIQVEVPRIAHHAGGPVMILTGHEEAVNSVDYSSDGRLLASGSEDGTVRIWDMWTGEDVTTLVHSGDGAVWSVAFAPNIQRVASGTDSGIVCIWSLVIPAAVPHKLKGHSAAVSCVLFSSNESHLASASFDKTVRLWSPATCQQLALLRGHTDKVHTLAFSPDGQTLASGSEDRTIRIWSVLAMKIKSSYRQENSIRGVCFLDEDKIAAAAGDRVILCSTRTGSETETVYNGSEEVLSVRSSPGGRSLAVVHASNVCILAPPQWTRTIEPIRIRSHTDAIRSAMFSPDGLYIVSASVDCTVRVCNTGAKSETDLLRTMDEAACARITSNSRRLTGHTSDVRSVVVSQDGTTVVSGSCDRTVRIWDAQTGREKLAPLRGHTDEVYSVAISSDGRTVASGSLDCTVRLWDALTGRAIGQPMIGHQNHVRAVLFLRDGRRLASGSDDGTVRFWDIAAQLPSDCGTLRCTKAVHTIAISPDNQYFAAGTSNGFIYLWRTATGEPAREPLWSGNGHSVHCTRFSPDGRHIASGEWLHGDGVIWDILTGQKIFVLRTNCPSMLSIAYSPNGQILCTGMADGAVCLWNTETGALILELRGHSHKALSVTFTSDGRSIVSGSVDNTIRIWNLIEARAPTPEILKSVEAPVLTSAVLASIEAPGLTSAILENGWLTSPSGELLLWVPVEYRQHLLKTQSDLQHATSSSSTDGMYRGQSWTSCWRMDS